MKQPSIWMTTWKGCSAPPPNWGPPWNLSRVLLDSWGFWVQFTQPYSKIFLRLNFRLKSFKSSSVSSTCLPFQEQAGDLGSSDDGNLGSRCPWKVHPATAQRDKQWTPHLRETRDEHLTITSPIFPVHEKAQIHLPNPTQRNICESCTQNELWKVLAWHNYFIKIFIWTSFSWTKQSIL